MENTKNIIVEQITRCLDRHNQEYEVTEIEKLYDHWEESKSELKNILSRHPNWNETALAVVYDCSFNREIDSGAYDHAANYLWQMLRSIYVKDGEITDVKKYDKFHYLITNSCLTSVNDDYKAGAESYGIKCNIGQKVSRILNKVFTEIGLDKQEDYNKIFAQLSDAINPLLIKRHTVLSIHPCDYLHMSYGNSWSSCHNIDEGCYMAGTLSYMCDPSSMVLTTIDESYNGDSYWEQKR